MAFEQNQIPKDLRPLNVAPAVAEEARITPKSRNVDSGSPGSGAVFYPATVTDSGFVGLGYPTALPGAAPPWRQQVPVAFGHPGMTVGFNYAHSVGNRVVGNVADWACNDGVAGGMVYGSGLGNQVGECAVDQLSSNSGTGFGGSPSMRVREGVNGSDRASEEGGDDLASGRKVKFLCSFGGKILPRPSDGMLRYVGGQTRIISVRKDVSFSELARKMADTYGQPVVIKYQLPDEDLDALVSVACADDLENMLDEYEKLVERSPDGSAKLRMFLLSASELDPVKFTDFQDSAQKYVEAVNGVVDGVSGGIMRKESMTSATSTQNSDFSVTEAVDNSGLGQIDASGSQSTVLSPKGNLSIAHDTSPRVVLVDPIPAVQSGIPVVKTGPLPTLSAEAEVDRCFPLNVQYQSGVGFLPAAHHMHTYVGPRQETMNSIMLPPQMGPYGPIFTQKEFRDDAPIVSAGQFMPAVHMTMTPSSSLVGMRPTMMQQQQTRLDCYPEQSTFGGRVVQVPVGPNYNAYQGQVSSAMVGGGYVWNSHVRPQESLVFSDGLVSRQVMVPEKFPRLVDCYLCQKALPHAHSDTMVQGQKGGVASSPLSDSNTVFHSLPSEDNMRTRPMNMGMASRGMEEGRVDQGAASRSRVLGHMGQQVGTPQPEAFGFSQSPNLDVQYQNDKIIFQNADNPNHPKTLIPHGLTGLAGGVQSQYGVYMGGIPQSFQNGALQQQLMPIQYRVQQEAAAVNKPVKSDAPSILVLPSQTSEALVRESPKEYNGLSKDDSVDVRMETLHIHPPGILINNEQSNAPTDEPRKEDTIIKSQQAPGREGILDIALSKPQMVMDAKPLDMPYHTRTRHLDPTETRGKNAVTGAETTCVVDNNIPPGSEWRDDTSRFPPILGNVETFHSNGNVPPSSKIGDSQDFPDSLFSNQDPWTMQQDTHFLPPTPNKILTKRETSYTPFGDNNMVNGGELLAEALLEEEKVPQPVGNSDSARTTESEELIKQELKATAEGVAANVLQTSMSSNLDIPVLKGNEPASESNGNSGVSSSFGTQHKPMVEDLDKSTEMPEKGNLAYPASDDLNRLQIIKNSDLEELRELGSGTFGTVYHGKWKGTDVAIKRINDRCFAGKASEQERMRDDFWNEAIKLADLHHPNVVAFYGIVIDGPGGSVATVTEYMVNGSLRTALQRNERNLDKRKRLLIAMDVAFGMEYLHGKNIVHFDLKSDNLLVNLRDPHRPICKVGDLGLSKVKCKTLISGGVRGTLPWMAPELLNGSSSLVSEKVDVFSFGIVLWELLTGEEPYTDLHYGAIIGGIVSNTLRPSIPKSCDLEWKSLMERCWAAEPAERPNFTVVADELRLMAINLPPRGQAQATQTQK